MGIKSEAIRPTNNAYTGLVHKNLCSNCLECKITYFLVIVLLLTPIHCFPLLPCVMPIYKV